MLGRLGCTANGAGELADDLPGPLGQEILTRTCSDCWAEWQTAEVMVINEMRLNFMDPKAQDVLFAEMRRFLLLDG